MARLENACKITPSNQDKVGEISQDQRQQSNHTGRAPGGPATHLGCFLYGLPRGKYEMALTKVRNKIPGETNLIIDKHCSIPPPLSSLLPPHHYNRSPGQPQSRASRAESTMPDTFPRAPHPTQAGPQGQWGAAVAEIRGRSTSRPLSSKTRVSLTCLSRTPRIQPLVLRRGDVGQPRCPWS
jgi:hypothetical protein